MEVQLENRTSFCRICSGGCGVVLSVDHEGRICSIRGDKANSLSKGYACFKGLHSGASHNAESRLLQPLERRDGAFSELPLETALDRISDRLADIIARHGPDSVAVFCGNGAVLHNTALQMQRSFVEAIGSTQFYTTLTIDQSAKLVSFGRLGAWKAGIPPLEEMQVALMFGANPLISHSSLGYLTADPVRRLKAARKGGLKLITIDPRRTETSANADLALQPFPGQDPAIAGGLIRIILKEGWHDSAFCDQYVGAARLDALRAAVEPLTEAMVEARAGLEPGQLRLVTEMFARDAQRGCAHGATGPNMAPFSNLAQHLIDCLNVICGRFLREGERVRQIIVTDPPAPSEAGVIPAGRHWEADGPSRIRGYRNFYGERLSATLAEEILTPGQGQIRALIVNGGDPATSLPGRAQTLEALRSLDLLVTIDPWLGPTAQMADFVLPPLLQYERSDISAAVPGYPLWPGAWMQYSPPVVAPPAGANLADDWYFFWSLAKRLGKTIRYAGKTDLPMDRPPTTDDLLSIQLAGSWTTLDALKESPHGLEIELGDRRVQPDPAAVAAQFDVMPADVAAELETFVRRSGTPGNWSSGGKPYQFLLSTRRLRDFFNSNGIHNEAVRARNPYNPAYLNPQDLGDLGLAENSRALITSPHGEVTAIVRSDPDLRRGVISMAHGWGEGADETPDAATKGTCVNWLTESSVEVEAINAMPHISAIPVNITAIRQAQA